jgi:hypothetical protein
MAAAPVCQAWHGLKRFRLGAEKVDQGLVEWLLPYGFVTQGTPRSTGSSCSLQSWAVARANGTPRLARAFREQVGMSVPI